MPKIYEPDKKRILYKEPHRQLYERDGQVLKIDPYRLNFTWRNSFEEILKVWKIPGFVQLIDNGYITQFIEGTDLHGNRPFIENEKSEYETSVSDHIKLKALSIFNKAIEVGTALGFTLGDITCGNMITNGHNVFLIDYDNIVTYPLEQEIIDVWMGTLDLLFSKRKI